MHITTPIVYPKSSLCSLPLLYRSSSYSSPFRCSILFPVPLSFLFLTIAPNPFVLPSSSFLPALAIVSSSLSSLAFLFSNPLILISSSRLLQFLSSHAPPARVLSPPSSSEFTLLFRILSPIFFRFRMISISVSRYKSFVFASRSPFPVSSSLLQLLCKNMKII